MTKKSKYVKTNITPFLVHYRIQDGESQHDCKMIVSVKDKETPFIIAEKYFNDFYGEGTKYLGDGLWESPDGTRSVNYRGSEELTKKEAEVLGRFL